jgi:hypothetical protein
MRHEYTEKEHGAQKWSLLLLHALATNNRWPNVWLFGNFIKAAYAKYAFASFIPIARTKTTFGSAFVNRWPNVWLFGNFIKAAYAKYAFASFIPIARTKTTFGSTLVNGGQMSGSSAIS